MCARYELDIAPRNIIERFGLKIDDSVFVDFQPANDVRPTFRMPVIGVDGEISFLRWGLDVPWQKKLVINARSETASQKPTFKPLIDQRVVVPATAYFEWRKDGSKKIKTRICVTGTDVFGMAGFYKEDRFVILTCSPAPSIAHIHNRMLVVLPQSLQHEWLNPDVSFDDLAPNLIPYEESLEAIEQSPPKPKQGSLPV